MPLSPSTRLGLVNPAGGDNLSSVDNTIVTNNAIVDDAAIYKRGTFVSRPAAGTVPNGTIWHATDLNTISIQDGGSWRELGALLPTGSVGSAQIATGAVGSDEIALSAVGSAEIAAGAVNGTHIADNAVSGDEIAEAAKAELLDQYKLVAEVTSRYVSAGTALGLNLISPHGVFPNGSHATGIGMFHFQAADFDHPGLSTRLRMKALVSSGSVAPLGSGGFTFGIHPVTASGGASGLNAITVGGAVTGAVVNLANAANGVVRGSSGDFIPPGDDVYAFAVNLTTAIVSGAVGTVWCGLYVHNVTP